MEIQKIILSLFLISLLVGCGNNLSDVSMEYRIDTNPRFAGVPLPDTSHLIVQSLSDNIDVDRVEVNRGNCPILPLDGQNPMSYGQTIKFVLRCNPRDIQEVKVYLKDGREVLMTPR